MRNNTQASNLKADYLDEDEIQTALFQQIAVRGVHDAVFFHIPGNPRSARDGARLKRLGAKIGMPDIGIIHRGRIMLLEVKRFGGRQSREQILRMHELMAAGGVYACAYGLDHCIEVLEAWGVLLTSVRANMFPTEIPARDRTP
jgi:hypothetical protein